MLLVSYCYLVLRRDKLIPSSSISSSTIRSVNWCFLINRCQSFRISLTSELFKINFICLIHQKQAKWYSIFSWSLNEWMNSFIRWKLFLHSFTSIEIQYYQSTDFQSNEINPIAAMAVDKNGQCLTFHLLTVPELSTAQNVEDFAKPRNLLKSCGFYVKRFDSGIAISIFHLTEYQQP